MCGIAGILLDPKASDPRRLAAVSAMAATLLHRGPDDAGIWIDHNRGIALGHRRLSIIDLSAAGHQPMVSHQGGMVITYNGEIYNFAESRRELERIGHQFRGQSDTEVALAAMENFGIESSLRRFAGMFAIGLWDSRANVLHLVRDRLGKKPLYIALFDGMLLFASELKALLTVPGFRPSINADAMDSVLRLGWVPEDQCIFHDVFKLPPGTMLSVKPTELASSSVESLQERVYRWWSLAEVAERGQRQPFKLSDADIDVELDQLLRLVVRERMVADVPLGAFLSGGIDSSTVVALMQAQSSRPVRTFTIGFREAKYDESSHASLVARHLGTAHTELRVTPEEVFAVVPELPTIWDEPFAAESQIPTLLVSRLARQHVTVALSGDGGDEAFGGYNRHFHSLTASLMLALPLQVRRAAASLVRIMAEGGGQKLIAKSFIPGVPRLPGGAARIASLLGVTSECELYQRLISIASLTTPGRGASDSVPAMPTLPDLAARMMYRDSVTYLPGDILAKVDRATMAVSLEARCPLLDHRILEFAWQLPTAAKVRNGTGKLPLRRILRRYLPDALFDRPKHGFNVPLDAWLKGPLREWSEDLLVAPRLARDGYLDAREIAVCRREHASGHRDRGHEIWAMLMTEAWLATAPKAGGTGREAATVEPPVDCTIAAQWKAARPDAAAHAHGFG